jgi:TRAP-type C4-dicarboxylate transport system substrate-binding protein
LIPQGPESAQKDQSSTGTEDGLRHTINAKRPIRTPEDLRVLRLRTPQHAVFIEAFRALGAEVVPMPWGKALLDALARGALDGVEATVRTIWDFEVFRAQRYLSLTGHIYVPAVIVMSKVVYDRLSEDDRQAFVEAARLAGQNGREDNNNMEAAGVADLLGVGVQINADVDKAAFRAALVPAYIEWRQQFGDLIERIQAYQ